MITGNIKKNINITTDTFEISGSNTPINVVVVDSNNLDISECTLVTTEVIKTNPPINYFDECGCPINVCQKGSLRISIKKLDPEPNDCGFTEFILDDNGLILFITNKDKTYFIASECCESLGFEPEINPETGLYQCRWKEEEVDDCTKYVVIGEAEGFIYFQNVDGSNTIYVPSKECCPNNTIPELTNFGYRCGVVKEVDSCSNYTYTGLEENGYLLFTNQNGVTSNIVPTNECCTALGYTPKDTGNGIACLICRDYVSYDFNNLGIAVFVDSNGNVFEGVSSNTCCPRRTIPINEITDNGDTLIKCKSNRILSTCRYLKSITGRPNPTGSLTSIEVSGKYCDGELFSFNFNGDDLNSSINTYELVERCVIEDSIEIFPFAPQRIQFEWTSQSCDDTNDFVEITVSPIDSGVNTCSVKSITISGRPGTIVDFEFFTVDNGNHGYTSEFTANNGTYFVNNKIIIPSSGSIEVTWDLCARPTLQIGAPNCVAVRLEFKVNNEIIRNITSTACSDGFN